MAFDSQDLFDTGSTPGLAPRVKLEKSSGGPGGFGADLAAAAGGALGIAQSDPLTEALVSLQIQLAPAPNLGACRLRFLPRSDFPSLGLGDPLTVKLSGGGDPVPVFAGHVARLANRHGALEVLLSSPAAALARIRRNTSYENQSYSDLLSSWAADAGLTAGDIDSGPDYAFLAIDDTHSLWDWVARLARHGDMPAWSDAQGRLNAHQPRGEPVATFRWGETLLDLNALARDPATTAARMVGEGSAGRQGSEAWAWLAKDSQGISASTGSGPSGALQQDGALRSLASVASAVAGSAAAVDVVRVTVLGTPELEVASVFALEGCPGGSGDGHWGAAQVRHRLQRGFGFVSEVLGEAL